MNKKQRILIETSNAARSSLNDSLQKDVEKVRGLVRAVEDAETRLEYMTLRRLIKRHTEDLIDTARSIVSNTPAMPTELTREIVGDWEGEFDKAWDTSTDHGLWSMIQAAESAGPEAVEALRAHLAKNGVDLDEVKNELGLKVPQSDEDDEVTP